MKRLSLFHEKLARIKGTVCVLYIISVIRQNTALSNKIPQSKIKSISRKSYGFCMFKLLLIDMLLSLH